MKIKKPKRIMSLFLAALMCVTSLVGIGTTAYAAEETDDVYLISYPRDGDSNYNAEWGHGSLTFMNGWKTGTSRYTTVRAMSYPFYLIMVAYGRAAEGVYETQIAWLPWLPVAVGITILALVVSCMRYGASERR